MPTSLLPPDDAGGTSQALQQQQVQLHAPVAAAAANAKSAADVEREQELLYLARYGGGAGGAGAAMLKRKQPLIARDHGKQFFDSADWSLAKGRGEKSVAAAEESLPPLVGPTPAIAAARRRSDCATGLSRHEDN